MESVLFKKRFALPGVSLACHGRHRVYSLAAHCAADGVNVLKGNSFVYTKR